MLQFARDRHTTCKGVFMSEYISANHIFLDNPATTTAEALDFLAEKAVELGISSDKEAVLAGFMDREEMGATGLQAGFAIPRCKSEVVNDAAILVVKFAGDVEWKSLDGRPVRMAVALFAPDGDVHLTLLSIVADMLTDESMRARLMGAPDAEAIAALINRAMVNA
jgi:PTS system fructose-specific IIA component